MNIQIFKAKDLNIVYNEIINENRNEFINGVDLVSNSSYSVDFRDTTLVQKGNLIGSSRKNEVFYIDKVYENKISYKSILNLFDSEIYTSTDDVGLSTLFNTNFKTNSDMLSNYDNINLITDIKAVVEIGVNNMMDVIINSMFTYNQHLRVEVEGAVVNIYIEDNQSNLYINTIHEENFIEYSLPDINNTYTKCIVNIAGVESNYYLLKNNTITTNASDTNRYERVKTKYIYKDSTDETPYDLALGELKDTDDYIATLIILNASYIFSNTSFYVGDSLTLDKNGRELYKGTITAIEIGNISTTIKLGFDREEFIFGKEV